MVSLLPIWSAILSACTGPTGNQRPDDTDPIDTDDSGGDDTDDTSTPPVDADGDGYVLGDDCNDTNASLYKTVEGYGDHDGDGYFADTSQGPEDACGGEDAIEEGYSLTPGDDCDDNQAYINPGPSAFQALNGIDTNCDGSLEIDLDRDAVKLNVGEYTEIGEGQTALIADVNDAGYDDLIVGSMGEGRVFGIYGGEGKLTPGNLITLYESSGHDFEIYQPLGQVGIGLGGPLVALDLEGNGANNLIVSAGSFNSPGAGDGTKTGALILMQDSFPTSVEVTADALGDESTFSSLGILGVVLGWANSSVGDFIHVLDDIDGDGEKEIVAGQGSSCYAIPAVGYSGIQQIDQLGGFYFEDDPGYFYYGNQCEHLTSGDITGDGAAELLTADTVDYDHDGAGEVLLIKGGTIPDSLNFYTIDSSGAQYVLFRGNVTGANAGSTLAIADVINEEGKQVPDGVKDTVIGVDDEDNGVLYAIPGGAIREIFDGTHPTFGLGDEIYLDGDILVLGGVRIYETSGEGFASTALAANSDLDGNGAPDLVSSTVAGVGDVYMFKSPLSDADGVTTETELSTAQATQTIDGDYANYFGKYVFGGGDVDGDGSDDLLISAPNASSGRGVQYLVFGGVTD